MSAEGADHADGAKEALPAWVVAVDRYRDATAWVIGAFGAIGVVVVAMIPVAGLADDAVHSAAAVVVGVVVASAGVLVAMLAALWSLAPRAMYPGTLRAVRRGWFRRSFTGWARLENALAVAPERLLPAGISDVDDFEAAIRNLPRLAAEQSLTPSGAEASEATIVRLGAYRAARANLYGVARFELARTRFVTSLVVMSFAVAVTVVGLGVATWGLVGVSTDVPSSGEAGAATAVLTSEGAESLSNVLGKSCVAGDVEVVVLSGRRSSSAWEVVTIDASKCKVVRFTLTSELGTLRWK